jgi:hypothetical protein
MRSRRSRARSRALALVGIGVGIACEPIVYTAPPLLAPINACPEHPCDAYRQPGDAPSCNEGVCTVSTPTTNLLMVIALATDSFLAPGRTYLTTLNGGPSATSDTCTGDCCLIDCNSSRAPAADPDAGPTCVLDSVMTEGNQPTYLVNQTDALQAGWYLGDRNTTMQVNTTLPAQATFRRLYGQDGGSDALDLGLPVEPVQATNVPQPANGGPFGPNGSPQITFQTYLQPGCYERTLQPFAPLSSAFPPEIKPWPPDDVGPVAGFDPTMEETGLTTGQKAILPQFDIRRAEGLDGWTVYLRNTQTKRVFSNVVSLRGSRAPSVTLLTNHATLDAPDALAGLELVLAPPAGQPQPTYVVPRVAQALPSLVVYPSLLTPVTVTGRIATPAGAPVPADVYFTATDITNPVTGQAFPPNFEFTTAVSATRDPRTGASTYSTLLPQGHYRITARPTDSAHAVTAISWMVGGEGNLMTGVDVDVGPLVSVSGTARVADDRPLAEALVEVLPTACAPNAGSTSTPDASPDCLPRNQQASTGDDGSFQLAVDPGDYILRIEPRQGSRLPWKVEHRSVGPLGLSLGTVVIPAPISVGMVLQDTSNNAEVNALVRVFTDPTQKPGTAVELGQAITDANGRYELYIAAPDALTLSLPDSGAPPGF